MSRYTSKKRRSRTKKRTKKRHINAINKDKKSEPTIKEVKDKKSEITIKEKKDKKSEPTIKDKENKSNIKNNDVVNLNKIGEDYYSRESEREKLPPGWVKLNSLPTKYQILGACYEGRIAKEEKFNPTLYRWIYKPIILDV